MCVWVRVDIACCCLLLVSLWFYCAGECLVCALLVWVAVVLGLFCLVLMFWYFLGVALIACCWCGDFGGWGFGCSLGFGFSRFGFRFVWLWIFVYGRCFLVDLVA